MLVCVCVGIYQLRSLAPAFDEAFQVGTEQQFSLSNIVQVGGANNDSKQVGYQFQAIITVGAVWGTQDSRLLMIQIKNPVVSSLPDLKPGSVEGLETPFYAWWQLGRINAVYFTESDSVQVRNSKKAIGALLQFQLLDGTYVEEDPSGLCKVTYTSRSSTRYHKTKGSCQFDSNRVQRTEYPLQSKVKISRNTDFTVSTEGSLQTVVSREFVKYLLNAFNNLGAYYESAIEMKATGSSRKAVVLQGSNIEEVLKDLSLESDTLQMQNYRSTCTGNKCESTVTLFKKYQHSLTDGDIGTGKSSTTLIELVLAVRQATVEELLRILKAKTSQPLKGQLLDILGAAQTVASHEAAKTEFSVVSNEVDTSLAERYLQALAIATRPQKEIIEDLLQLAQNEPKNVKLADSLIQCLSAVTQRYAQIEADGYDSELVRKVTSFLMERIEGCTKDGCKLRYIRGLHNLKNPVTAHMLLKLVQEAPRAISVAAMKGLKSFSVHLWNDEFKSSFDAILFQVFRRYDSSARALAFDILLDMKPNYFELMHLMQLLKSTDKSFEVKQYMLQKLRMLADQCRDFAVLLRKVIEGDPALNNYHVLVPKGLSTALSRQFSEAPTFNASITSLQEMSGGLFAEGLSSFVSSDTEESNDADDEETMAGMELSIQGTVMRPLVFFSGKGELMGHVWSGTASERTPAYQATTLLQDNEEWFHSHSGATLRLSATGAISIDLNGQVTMSLWGRNAQSKVEQNTGITMAGSLSAETGFASIGVNFSTVQEPQLHLTSALDFSSDPVLCMQLVQPKTTMKEQLFKTVSLAGWKQSTVYKTTKLYNFTGLTHALNRKNNEMCNLIS
ncbi:AGAP010234-PA-like protein [Anopheles sinensis]|uniref:AGAP010234-PA-like protein n=1 Tax=Anopheles sinensis TaxID=74873 RepID=A0A084W5I4_ANOSI|nr:AGAP010234-PA-like protein [Anopheles sinensis]